MNKVRCAIYTRKSSEEGLEQDFNSLHAQREACAAYILSQASEGWSLLPEMYDDGGLSGGTLERPALQRLFADVEAGKVDIVVVYKVDRLTRSLLDFAKLVETMDRAEVSFVSVTQSFNTTTSMGRLTLNMLLSFAQFEREVTAERIRDKIAASKAKGMWMGGNPPIGYQPDGRTLKIKEEHAALIQDIYRRYLDIGNVRLVKQRLDEEGIIAPQRTTSTGRRMGGAPFSRAQIYRILSNPIYVGEIHHSGKEHKGLHKAIIDRELWNAVQRKLGDHRQGEQRSATIKSPSVLAGRVFDDNGEPLVASHACKGKVRYRYYVSRSLQHEPGSGTDGWRIPAKELEGAVTKRLLQALDQPLGLVALLGIEPHPDALAILIAKVGELADWIRRKKSSTIRPLIDRVFVSSTRLTIELDARQLQRELGLDAAPTDRRPELIAEVRLTRSGRTLRLVQTDGRSPTVEVDQTLVQLLQRARSWWQELAQGNLTIAQLSREKELNTSYITRTVRLAFLAPEITAAIIAGIQPAALTADVLRRTELPFRWSDQRDLFGI